MADASRTIPRTDESFRGTAVAAYILFLIGWPFLHLPTIVGVILAYVQRGESRGTIWESHFSNIIETFWFSLLIGIVAIPLCFVGVGFLLFAFLVIWFLYRTIKGLVSALDGQPYG